MSDLPPLPKIDGDFDLMLDVYTHSSLRFANTPMNEDYGDTQRLGEVGSRVLDLTVTYHLYSMRPLLNAEDIQRKRADIVSDANLNDWVKLYGLKEKLRVAPNNIELLDELSEMRKFFHIYIGALYIRNGLAPIQTWISRLIDPAADVKLPNSPPQQDHNLASQMQTYGQQQPYGQQSYGQQVFGQPPYGQQAGYHSPALSQGTMSNYSSPSSQATSLSAPLPTGAPPPLPGSPPPSIPFASLNLVTLALVNQTATQKGYQATYPAEQVGPSHQPTWTVRCCMNGQEFGRGVGKSQKIAKEEAARQAWAALGW